MNNQELEELYTYMHPAEEKKIEVILNTNEIPFLIRSFEDTAYNGIFTGSMGRGKIFVFKKDLKNARALLKNNGITS